MRQRWFGYVALAAALVMFGCGDDDDTATVDTTTTTAAAADGETTTTAAAGTADNELAPLPEVMVGTEIETLLKETHPDDAYELGFAVPNRADPNFQFMIEKAEEYAKVLGVTLRVIDPGGYEAGPRQADQVDELVQAGVDGIALAAADAAALGPAVARAADAGVPVVTFISGENSGRAVAAVSNNLIEIGVKECENIVAEVPNAKVVMLSGPQGAETAAKRAQGFKECATANGLEILAERFGPSSRDDGLTQMENLYQSFSDQIQAIYTFSAYISLGAADAIQRAGVPSGEIYISTSNPDAEATERLRNGEIRGAVDQFTGIIASAALATLVQAANGEEVPKAVEIPIDAVSSEEAVDKDWSWSNKVDA